MVFEVKSEPFFGAAEIFIVKVNGKGFEDEVVESDDVDEDRSIGEAVAYIVRIGELLVFGDDVVSIVVVGMPKPVAIDDVAFDVGVAGLEPDAVTGSLAITEPVAVDVDVTELELEAFIVADDVATKSSESKSSESKYKSMLLALLLAVTDAAMSICDIDDDIVGVSDNITLCE